jgi:hypothetical protein
VCSVEFQHGTTQMRANRRTCMQAPFVIARDCELSAASAAIRRAWLRGALVVHTFTGGADGGTPYHRGKPPSFPPAPSRAWTPDQGGFCHQRPRCTSFVPGSGQIQCPGRRPEILALLLDGFEVSGSCITTCASSFWNFSPPQRSSGCRLSIT